MTLKTSFFNKGIYKSTVRRYMWGSVLYFILLFMFTALPVLLNIDPNNKYLFYDFNGNRSLLYEYGNYLFFPIMLAMGVSTVVGLLVYRFMHSKKTSVFTHSLPVSRTSVYTSTLAGAFTLMSVPVILNGLIFLVMSLTAYSRIITVNSCFVWIGLNLMCLFMMFACTTFVAMLTGNTFATIGLNILFHFIVPIVVICFGYVAEQFLFGYVIDNAFINSVVDSNFAVWIIKNVNAVCYWYGRNFELLRMFVYLAISVLLYVLGWVLYKKRSLETAEEVAGFKILNPLFKYLLTFLGTTVSFALFFSLVAEKLVMFIVLVALISAIVYFASEMILKKTFKVWKKSYKGFIGFAVVYTLLIFLFAFTSFFGYETYVPKAENVESVAVYSYYYEHVPYLDDPEVIDYAIKLHSGFVNNRTLLRAEFDGAYIDLNIEYKLKNGNEVKRAYFISESRLLEILSDMYEFEDYKAIYEEPLGLNVNDIQSISYQTETEVRIYGDLMNELHKCVVEDIKNMSYGELYYTNLWSSENTIKYYYFAEGYDGKPELFSKTYHLSPHFEKTKEWFNNNKDKLRGYYYPYTSQVYEGANFCIIQLDLYKEISESFENLGLSFEGLSWSKDELVKGNVICNEITDFNLENEKIIWVEGEDAKVVYDYVKNADNAVSYNGLWYIYGETAPDEFRIVDAITSDEAAEFKKAVCE